MGFWVGRYLNKEEIHTFNTSLLRKSVKIHPKLKSTGANGVQNWDKIVEARGRGLPSTAGRGGGRRG